MPGSRWRSDPHSLRLVACFLGGDHSHSEDGSLAPVQFRFARHSGWVRLLGFIRLLDIFGSFGLGRVAVVALADNMLGEIGDRLAR